MINIVEVKTKKQLKEFIAFPLKLYKGNDKFVPLLNGDEINQLTPKGNAAFEFCETRYWLAYLDGKVVGRLGAIWHKRFNELHNAKQIRFTRLDVIDNFDVTKALFDHAIAWAKEIGMNEIVGPLGFSDLDKEGMLVEGFDSPSIVLTLYNHPYYVEHLTKIGFVKDVDWVEYRIKIPEKPNEKLEEICRRTLERRNYYVLYFKNRKEMIKRIYEGMSIMNEVYSHLYGYVALTDRQIDEFIRNFSIVLNKKFVFAVCRKDTDELIGYGFLAPSLTKAMQKANGKLFPTGMFHLLHALKHFDTVDLYSIGVKKDYQNTGVNAIIMNEAIKACQKYNVKVAETGPELETNTQVQSQWKNFDHVQHKRRRSFKLEIK